MSYQHFSFEDLMKMPSNEKRHFFPRVSGIKSAVVVGSHNSKGLTNAAVFNSLTHIGSNPPLLGLVFRPLTVERHTYDNIKSTGCFSINLLNTSDLKAAHQTSAKYPKVVSEFDELNKTAVPSPTGKFPYWPSADIRIGLEYKEEYLIKANDTILLIGQVSELHIKDHLLSKDGQLHWQSSKPLLVNGLESYFTGEFIQDMDYPRV